MRKKLISVGLAATTAVSAVAFSTQAAAEHRRRDNDNTGVAIAAGVVGLAIGAALASGSNRNRGYDNRYYNGSTYDRGYGYGYGYQQPYYGSRYGGYGNYGAYGYSPYGSGYGYRCRTVTRWDPYRHRRVQVRECR